MPTSRTIDGLRLPSPVARFLVPGALYSGIALAFLTCMFGGYLATHRNPYHHFERFHFFLQPTTLFYPTPCQLHQLAREKLDPAKIGVIVGGSSILHGARQPPSKVWTRRLQELLGDRYQVLNFGFPAARPWEMGAVAMEILSQERGKLLFITDCNPGAIDGCPDGHYFRYCFWAAYYRGFLLADAPRARRLEEAADEPRANQAGKAGCDSEAIRLRAWLDSWLYFDDLWNTCAYRWLCTVWTPYTRQRQSMPRRKYVDPETTATPLRDPYPVSALDRYMGAVRMPLRGCIKDSSGKWVENQSVPLWATLQRNAAASFPEVLHNQTLLVLNQCSKYYVNQLSADERACLAEVGRLTVAKLEALGYSAIENGPELTVSDFADPVHLTESGGAKLAQAVAAKIQSMAKRLGYLD